MGPLAADDQLAGLIAPLDLGTKGPGQSASKGLARPELHPLCSTPRAARCINFAQPGDGKFMHRAETEPKFEVPPPEPGPPEHPPGEHLRQSSPRELGPPCPAAGRSGAPEPPSCSPSPRMCSAEEVCTPGPCPSPCSRSVPCPTHASQTTCTSSRRHPGPCRQRSTRRATGIWASCPPTRSCSISAKSPRRPTPSSMPSATAIAPEAASMA